MDPVERWDETLGHASATVVLCRWDNLPLRSVFAEAQDPLLIRDIQKLVISGEREPEY